MSYQYEYVQKNVYIRRRTGYVYPALPHNLITNDIDNIRLYFAGLQKGLPELMTMLAVWYFVSLAANFSWLFVVINTTAYAITAHYSFYRVRSNRYVGNGYSAFLHDRLIVVEPHDGVEVDQSDHTYTDGVIDNTDGDTNVGDNNTPKN